jgi:choline-sulfatase
MRTPVFLLLAILGAGCSAPTRRSLADLPARFEPIVLGPSAPLARYENMPFCTFDCQLNGEILSAGLPLRTRFTFYVDVVRPLDFEFEGRYPVQTSQPLTWLLNGRPWLTCPLTAQWATFRQPLPEAELHPGRNLLTMTMELGQAVEFRRWSVSPSLASAPPARLQGNDLRLPWNGNLAVALESQGASRLHLKALEGDLDPGAALPKDSFLRVSLRAPRLEWHRDVPLGQQLKVDLPASPSGWSKLQLMALSSSPPLPGQRGLRLRQPDLEVRRNGPVQAVPPPPPAAPAGRKVNVIVYLIDTLRADHLGCYGYSPSPSPALDAFAKESVLFADVSAQSGWTKPATASIWSSQWPWRHRVQDFADKLPANVPWLPELLQRVGYQTAGICCNSLAGPDFGYDRGYDQFQILPKGTSEEAQQATVDWLEHKRKPDKPFFLYVHTIDPHSPYMHSPRYRGRTRAEAEPMDTEPRALTEAAFVKKFRGESLDELKPRVRDLVVDYDREIANNDRNFGQLIDWLKRHDLYEDSLIVVVSDHGEEFLEHGHVGHLNSLYQELLHVPLLVKFPGGAGAGSRVRETWQQIDLAPTILQACGLEAPADFQGRAYAPGSPPAPERMALFSVQAGRLVLPHQARYQKPIFTSAHGIRMGSWMYQRVLASAAGQNEPEELYDLARDPGQRENLAQQDAGRSLSLSLLLEPLFQLTVQPPPSDESNRKLLELLRSLQYVR